MEEQESIRVRAWMLEKLEQASDAGLEALIHDSEDLKRRMFTRPQRLFIELDGLLMLEWRDRVWRAYIRKELGVSV